MNEPTTVQPAVEVRRSRRRKRTVSAYRDGETIVVMIPARMTRAEEKEWVTTMVDRVTRAEQRRRPSDGDLQQRAVRLSRKYLDGLADPASVRWVANQRARWGSCTPADGTIRLSERLQGMPAYVIDYVLLHELVHLLVPGHDEDFWGWLARYDLTERARGFLEGVSAVAHLEPPPGASSVDRAGDLDDVDQLGDLKHLDELDELIDVGDLDDVDELIDLGDLDGRDGRAEFHARHRVNGTRPASS